MLELEPLKKEKWITDVESEARLLIRPLPAEKHSSLRQAATKVDTLDMIDFMKRVAKFTLVNWEGVGKTKDEPVDCNDVSKEKFGKRFAYSLMPWVIEEAMKFDLEVSEETAEAKNV